MGRGGGARGVGAGGRNNVRCTAMSCTALLEARCIDGTLTHVPCAVGSRIVQIRHHACTKRYYCPRHANDMVKRMYLLRSKITAKHIYFYVLIAFLQKQLDPKIQTKYSCLKKPAAFVS